MNDHEARENYLDHGSYDGIYRQYSADAIRIAQTVATSSDEAHDIVYEAFARLLIQLRDYGPPELGVEDYLRVVVRRLALTRHIDPGAEGTIAIPDVDDQLAATADEHVVRGAFEALSDDWQQALWHHEMERKSELTLSDGLGRSPSEVATLVFQAREGLRQAYTASRMSAATDPDCGAFTPNIAIYVKGGMPSRLTRELLSHFDQCEGCTTYRDGYRYLVTNLREVLVKALLMPGGPPPAQVAPAAVVPDDLPTDEIPVVVAAGAEPAERDEVADGEVDDTKPVTRPNAEVITLVPHRDHRKRRAVAAAVTAVAVSGIAVAFILANGPSNVGSTLAALSPSGSDVATLIGGDEDHDGARLDPVQARVDDRRSASAEPTASSGTRSATGRPSVDGSPSTSTSPPPSARPSPSQKPGAAPEITAHPHDVIAAPGDTATFAVRASGEPEPSVQWQQNDSSGWSAIPGATSSTLSVNVADTSYDGRRYRAVVTNAVGTSTSGAAAISVQYAPQVTASPSSATAEVGGSATFTASVDAKPDVSSVQWQVQAPGSSWRNVSSVPPGGYSEFTVTGVTAEMDGNLYRAVFTNSRGTTTTSAAELTVTSPSPSPTGTGGA